MLARSREVQFARCCGHCRRHTILLIKRFLRAPILQMRCPYLGRDVEPTDHCFLFRWADEHRPPKPEKAAPAAVPIHEILPPQEVGDA